MTRKRIRMDSKRLIPKLGIGLALIALVGCENKPYGSVDELSEWVITDSGLSYKVVEVGTGPYVEIGDKALIHETTKLRDGTVVTDTWEMNFPIEFVVGGKQVIDGMDEAVSEMRVGERRELVVPPSLSVRSTYSADGLFGPADTLYYNVMLLRLTSPEDS